MTRPADRKNLLSAAVALPTATTLRLDLKCKADPALYDLPFTLVTQVPADWGQATITQGTTKASAKVEQGSVRFDATPGLIILEKGVSP